MWVDDAKEEHARHDNPNANSYNRDCAVPGDFPVDVAIRSKPSSEDDWDAHHVS